MSKTFADIQARYQILKGDDSSLVADTTGKSHINAAKDDIVSAFPFSWTQATTTLTLSAGVATLPAAYNPGFQLEDARIDTTVLIPIPIGERDNGNDNVYWITYNSATDTYIFNSNTLTGSVVVYYHVDLTDMSSDTDKCRIPDSEAVAYLAAAKNWIGSERDKDLQADYAKEAENRIKVMINQDVEFGATYTEGSILDYNLLR